MTQRPTPQELEEAKARAERAESEASAWKADAATAHLKNQELRASLLEAVGYLNALGDNLLRNDADMMLDDCEDPKDVAARLSSSLEGGEG